MLPHPALSLLERPILFSGEMVRAILDGRKTQTRRVRMFRDKPSRFQVGMRLWVRETWADTTGMGLDEEGIVYRATDPDWSAYEGFKWRPSIFMPRYASRITLQIIQVRVERVQEISAEDALAEGFGHATKPEGPHRAWVPRRLFSRYWDELNAKRGYGWETNPRVWAISFRRPVRWPARR